MVSVAGYGIGEYVFAVVISYLLIVLGIAVWTVVSALYDRKVWVPLAAGLMVFVVVQVIYLLDVRLAAVGMINGILLATSAGGLIIIFNTMMQVDDGS